MSRIQHITTFYKHFSLIPRDGMRFMSAWGRPAMSAARKDPRCGRRRDGGQTGETDSDLNFSVETVSCLGCCALGPVMVVDGEIHGNVDKAETAEVLKQLDQDRVNGSLEEMRLLSKGRLCQE